MGNGQSTHVFREPHERFKSSKELRKVYEEEEDEDFENGNQVGMARSQRPRDIFHGMPAEMRKRNVKAKRVPATESPDPEPRCPLCEERYHIQQQVIRLSCGHDFDESCIHDWLDEGNRICPLCPEYLSPHQIPTDTIGHWKYMPMNRRLPVAELIARAERHYTPIPAELGHKRTRDILMAALFPRFFESEYVNEKQEELEGDHQMHSKFIGARPWSLDKWRWSEGEGVFEEIRSTKMLRDMDGPIRALNAVMCMRAEAPIEWRGHAATIEEFRNR